jgi:tetratricopeptide (TPR) repeat protein
MFSHLEVAASRAAMIPLQRAPFMPPFSCQFTPEAMRDRTALKALTLVAALMLALGSVAFPARAQDANAAKARGLVNAAIKMTDSDAAVKLLWQATELDPTLGEAYVYLGLYYNSRSDFTNVVKVYQKLIKHQPNQVGAYLNIGEAYMSFSPPRADDALVYYRKGYALDPRNTFAALRIGELLAQTGRRDEALKYLKIALGDGAKNPTVASEAEKTLKQMGAL